MHKRFFAILFCLFFILFNTNAYAISQNDINAEAAILINADTGQILFEKNSNLKFAPASTTKILTALIALDKCNLSDKVIVGKKPPYVEGSKIYLLEGEEVTIEQLLYALLLSSANDAAEVIAEHISGSVQEFAKLMNEYAKEIGCSSSNFVNPHGLYDDNHYTTAYDLALIAKKAMSNETFRNIIATKSYKIPATNKQSEIRYLNNHNKLLWKGGKYYYPYATGMKTGYTIKAKHTFVGSATKDGVNLIAVVLKSSVAVYPDIQKLFEYGFNNFTREKLFTKDEPITYINLDNDKVQLPVYPIEDYYYLKNKSESSLPEENIILYKTAENTESINENEVVGKVEILKDGNVIATVDLISKDSYKKPILNTPKINNATKKFKVSFKYTFIAFLSLFISRGLYKKFKRKYKRVEN